MCSGKKVSGCQTAPDYHGEDMEEELYHCIECEFDFCVNCYEVYGNHEHEHPLEKLTL